MARINIKCHAAPGFDGVWAAKRKWPAAGIDVETIDGDADVEPASVKDVLQICPATLRELEETGRFSFGIAGTLEEVETVRTENAALKARVAELETENAALKAAADNGEGKSGKKK